MTASRSRLALFGALLAFVAILGLSALSVWHSAMVNDADPVHAVSVGHIDGTAGTADPDGPLHVAAHATGQILPIANEQATTIFADRIERIWARFAAAFRSGSDPSSLLRPPRA